MKRALVYLDGGLASQMSKVSVGLIIGENIGKEIIFDTSFYKKNLNHHNGLEICDVFPNVKIKTKCFLKYSEMLPGFIRTHFNVIVKFISLIQKCQVKTVCESFEKKLAISDVIHLCNSTHREVYFIAHWLLLSDYLEPKESWLKELFVFNEKILNQKTNELKEKINNNDRPVVSLHIRRGDYFSSTQQQSFWEDICADGYYTRAINFLQSRITNALFIVFSDDTNWVNENISLPPNYIMVDWNRGKESWQDMYLMSICDHNIIANSGFSVWGAILNKNLKKIVICPSKWVKNQNLDHQVFSTWNRL